MTLIAPVHKDERIKYIPVEVAASPVISKGENHVGSIAMDPSVACKHRCYLGLSLNSSGEMIIFMIICFSGRMCQ